MTEIGWAEAILWIAVPATTPRLTPHPPFRSFARLSRERPDSQIRRRRRNRPGNAQAKGPREPRNAGKRRWVVRDPGRRAEGARAGASSFWGSPEISQASGTAGAMTRAGRRGPPTTIAGVPFVRPAAQDHAAHRGPQGRR